MIVGKHARGTRIRRQNGELVQCWITPAQKDFLLKMTGPTVSISDLVRKALEATYPEMPRRPGL